MKKGRKVIKVDKYTIVATYYDDKTRNYSCIRAIGNRRVYMNM